MTRSPAMVLGIVATLVLGLGVGLVVLVRQSPEPIVGTPATAVTPAPAPPSAPVVDDPAVPTAAATSRPGLPPPPPEAPASPPAPADVAATPASEAPAKIVESAPSPDIQAKEAEEVRQHKNRRGSRALLPMLHKPKPITITP